MTSAPRTVLHVDMDAFFAAVEQQTYPFLRGKPVGVCGDPDGRTVVAAASYEAKRRGVKTAMTVPEARRRCPEIVLVGGDPAKYIDTSVRLLAIYAQYTDLVEVFSIDEAFLDVTASAHLRGGAEAVARAIKSDVRRRFGLTCSIGIAPNKLVAKFASDWAKPDGLTVIPPGELPALLARTPIEALCGIGPKTRETLNQLGITTCAELGCYPERQLVALFGVNGAKLSRMGRGEDSSPVQACCHETPAVSMGHSLTLARDTHDPTVIRRHLLQLAEQVGRRLRRDRYSGRTVAIVIRYSDFTTRVRRRSLRSHTDDGHRLYTTGMKLFDELYETGRDVRLLGISLSGLVRDLPPAGLFDSPDVPGDDVFLRAADLVNDRFGEFTVARARLTHRARGPGIIAPSWRPDRRQSEAPPRGGAELPGRPRATAARAPGLAPPG
jgi:DNA polymerase-4